MSSQTWSYNLWTLGSPCPVTWLSVSRSSQKSWHEQASPCFLHFWQELRREKNEQGKIRVPLNPSMIRDSGLSESGFGWWCHLHINVCFSCYHCSTETVSVRTSKSPLWLTSACKLSTASFLICPFLPWLLFFSWLLH